MPLNMVRIAASLAGLAVAADALPGLDPRQAGGLWSTVAGAGVGGAPTSAAIVVNKPAIPTQAASALSSIMSFLPTGVSIGPATSAYSSAMVSSSAASSYCSANGTTYQTNQQVTSGNSSYTIRCGTDNSVGSYQAVQVSSGGFASCVAACENSGGCLGWTYVGSDSSGFCYLKNSQGSFSPAGSNIISGFKQNPSPGGATTTSAAAAPTSTAPTDCEALASGSGPAQYTDSNGAIYNITCKQDIGGGNLKSVQAGAFQGCFAPCDQAKSCVGFSYLNGYCYLKSVQSGNLSPSAADVAVLVKKAANGVTATIGNNTITATVPGAPSVTPSAACTALPKQVGLYTNTCGADRLGGDLYSVMASSFLGCEEPCDAEDECVGYTYIGGSSPGTCYLKSSLSPQTNNSGVDVAIKPQSVISSIVSSGLPSSSAPSASIPAASAPNGLPTGILSSVPSGFTAVPITAVPASLESSVPKLTLAPGVVPTGMEPIPNSVASQIGGGLAASASKSSAGVPTGLLFSIPSGFTAVPTTAIPTGLASMQSLPLASGVVPSGMTAVPNSVASHLASASGNRLPSGLATGIPSGFTAIPASAIPSGLSIVPPASMDSVNVPSGLTLVPNSLTSHLATASGAQGLATNIPSGFTTLPTSAIPASLANALPTAPAVASGVVPSGQALVPNSIASQIVPHNTVLVSMSGSTPVPVTTISASGSGATSATVTVSPSGLNSAGGLSNPQSAPSASSSSFFTARIPSGFTIVPISQIPTGFASMLASASAPSGASVPSGFAAVPASIFSVPTSLAVPSSFSTSFAPAAEPTSAPPPPVPSASASMVASVVTHTVISQFSSAGSVASTSLAIPTSPPAQTQSAPASSTVTNFVTIPAVGGPTAPGQASAAASLSTASIPKVATTTQAVSIPSTTVVAGGYLPGGDQCRAFQSTTQSFWLISEVLRGNPAFGGLYFANPNFTNAEGSFTLAGLTNDLSQAADLFYYDGKHVIVTVGTRTDYICTGISLIPTGFRHHWLWREEAAAESHRAEQGKSALSTLYESKISPVVLTPGFGSESAGGRNAKEMTYSTANWSAWYVCDANQLMWVASGKDLLKGGRDLEKCAVIKLNKVPQ
ncbi:Hypothetical predicted protein [Lecanosticta acicola]|uniref:Apple domain-containing protein n=1 Tax=Lecanosticta acicola TaxID=111012 RepID=A0AAI9EEB7_9PEZI|nr:Hypothetical predicted protein [Lecanosticta acicola]